ncbi:glycosyltransferase family 2 protein [Flavobacterium terrigena]|uniref:Glycosyltransferase involved in cell wall bisynthesis n=1 Tax=Flavobacterium terrigena TaxID=402734 RepID=A0A1H6QYC6_9FLAO|nr:glycosyltransferase family 2 protein [Flavobacterium terrigena]SEI48513.1 Glycosyltransferase involved in cell wall bisynthesis [Flavobacterium terrigena]
MLAIIIPYYKLAFFEAALQSLANQTDKRFRVYIGDDASPEDCSTVLKQFEGHFDFKYHRFETNVGGTSLSQQWERCIELLDEDEKWFMILGDDDYLSENVVAEFYENYPEINEKSYVVRYATKVINQIDNVLSEVYTNPLFELGIEYISRKINGKTRGSLSEFVFNKKEFLKYKFTNYPSAFYSDDKIVLDLSAKKNIFSINEAIVFVRISSESLSGQTEKVNDKLFLARFQFYQYLIKNKLNFLDKFTRKIIIEKVLNHAIHNKEKQLSLFVILYFKSILLWDFNFFLKINKKYIKMVLGRSVD